MSPTLYFTLTHSYGQGKPSLDFGVLLSLGAEPDGREGRNFPCGISALPKRAHLPSLPRQIQGLPSSQLF